MKRFTSAFAAFVLLCIFAVGVAMAFEYAINDRVVVVDSGSPSFGLHGTVTYVTYAGWNQFGQPFGEIDYVRLDGQLKPKPFDPTQLDPE